MSYCIPVPFLSSEEHVEQWPAADSYKSLVDFLRSVNESCKGRENIGESERESLSAEVKSMDDVLSAVWKILDDIPATNDGRFGSLAFRTFYDTLAEKSEDIVGSILPDGLRDAAVELAPYFTMSFGNKERVDYGTGHELNFLAYLTVLARIGFFQKNDASGIGLYIVPRYLSLVQVILSKYRLEPAGSHGAWGLDDYSFIPFYFGSAQLVGQTDITPRDVLSEKVVNIHKDTNMYIGAVYYIMKCKTGPFSEHSPLLYDITGSSSWSKINSGMLRLYQDSILGKLPVIRHFLFGSILKQFELQVQD